MLRLTAYFSEDDPFADFIVHEAAVRGLGFSITDTMANSPAAETPHATTDTTSSDICRWGRVKRKTRRSTAVCGPCERARCRPCSAVRRCSWRCRCSMVGCSYRPSDGAREADRQRRPRD